MRKLLLLISFLFLLAPACAAPTPPPPRDTPDRELIQDLPGNEKYYFLRSSVQMYPEGIIVDTFREYEKAVGDSDARYVVETIRIVPFTNRIRTMSSKGYNTKGVLVFDHPSEEWQTPNIFTHGSLGNVVFDYCIKNPGKVFTKDWPVDDTSWYTKSVTDSSGDIYYFHPGWLEAVKDKILVLILVQHPQEKDGAKYRRQVLLLDPPRQKYYWGSGDLLDANRKKIRSLPEEAPDAWHTIEPGTEIGDFVLQILEYCRKSYITVMVPFHEAFPRLIPLSAKHPHHYFNPDSVVVRDGCLWVELIYHSSGSDAYTSLNVLRLSDRKVTTAGSHFYDDTGKEIKRNNNGIQWWNWKDIKPASLEEILFDAVLSYCRENGISLN